MRCPFYYINCEPETRSKIKPERLFLKVLCYTNTQIPFLTHKSPLKDV